MKTNVSTLLREFPRIRRIALSGEDVVVETREGNLRITADRSERGSILGAMKGSVLKSSDDLDVPTTRALEWDALR